MYNISFGGGEGRGRKKNEIIFNTKMTVSSILPSAPSGVKHSSRGGAYL